MGSPRLAVRWPYSAPIEDGHLFEIRNLIDDRVDRYVFEEIALEDRLVTWT